MPATVPCFTFSTEPGFYLGDERPSPGRPSDRPKEILFLVDLKWA